MFSPFLYYFFFPPRNRLTTQTEYATLVWNVTAAFERWALIKIRLCFAFLLQLTPPSLAAFTDTHSWFYCAGFLVFLSLLNHHLQRLLPNKIVGGDGCVKSVFLKYGFMSLSVWVYKWQWEWLFRRKALHSESERAYYWLTGREQSSVTTARTISSLLALNNGRRLG